MRVRVSRLICRRRSIERLATARVGKAERPCRANARHTAALGSRQAVVRNRSESVSERNEIAVGLRAQAAGVAASDKNVECEPAGRLTEARERWREARAGRPRKPGAALAAIWLILPVVICLSQRLSHAGVSTSCRKAKLRMAH